MRIGCPAVLDGKVIGTLRSVLGVLGVGALPKGCRPTIVTVGPPEHGGPEVVELPTPMFVELAGVAVQLDGQTIGTVSPLTTEAGPLVVDPLDGTERIIKDFKAVEEYVTITVTGPRASGKTTTAARLVALLRAMGHQATYCGRTHEQEEAVERVIRSRVVGCLPLKFHVRDEQ